MDNKDLKVVKVGPCAPVVSPTATCIDIPVNQCEVYVSRGFGLMARGKTMLEAEQNLLKMLDSEKTQDRLDFYGVGKAGYGLPDGRDTIVH